LLAAVSISQMFITLANSILLLYLCSQKDKNKELEAKAREAERKYVEERNLREAAEAKLRAMKKKMRGMRGESAASIATDGSKDTEVVVGQETSGRLSRASSMGETDGLDGLQIESTFSETDGVKGTIDHVPLDRSASDKSDSQKAGSTESSLKTESPRLAEVKKVLSKDTVDQPAHVRVNSGGATPPRDTSQQRLAGQSVPPKRSMNNTGGGLMQRNSSTSSLLNPPPSTPVGSVATASSACVFEPVADGSTLGGSLNRSTGLVMNQANHARQAGPSAQTTSTSNFDPLHRAHAQSTDQVSAPVVQQGSLQGFTMDQNNVTAVPMARHSGVDRSDLIGFHTPPPMIQMTSSGSMLAENNRQALNSQDRVQLPHMLHVPQNQLVGMDFIKPAQAMSVQQSVLQFQSHVNNADSNANWQGGNQWNQLQQQQSQQQSAMNSMASGMTPHQTQGQTDASQWNQQQQQQHHTTVNTMASGMPASQMQGQHDAGQWSQQQQPHQTAINPMVNAMPSLQVQNDGSQWHQQQHQSQQTTMSPMVQSDTSHWNQQQQGSDASQWNQQQQPQQTTMNHMASVVPTIHGQNDTTQWNQQQQQQPNDFDPLQQASSDLASQQQSATMNAQQQAPTEANQWHQQQHENANAMQHTQSGIAGGFDPMQRASSEQSSAHARSNSMPPTEKPQDTSGSPDPFDQLVRRPPSGSQQLGL
jgi:hypothetical protein